MPIVKVPRGTIRPENDPLHSISDRGRRPIELLPMEVYANEPPPSKEERPSLDVSGRDMSKLRSLSRQAQERQQNLDYNLRNAQEARDKLGLTPQEMLMYGRHLQNLNGPGGVDRENGARSTLLNTTVEIDGKHYNLPRVYDGQILSVDDAIGRAKANGLEQYPSYNSQEEADKRYEQIHQYMEKDTKEFLDNRQQADPGNLSIRMDRGQGQHTPRGTDYLLPGDAREDPRPEMRFMFSGSGPDSVPRSGGSPNSREHMGPRGGVGHHGGWDVPATLGQPVLAPQDGTIVRMGTMSGYGQFTDMQFPDGSVHRFAHLGDMSKGGSVSPFPSGLKPGDQVSAGTPVGFAGYSGNAGREFVHAHVEVFKDRQAYDRLWNQSSRTTAADRLDPRTYYTQGLAAAIDKQNELFTRMGRAPGAPPTEAQRQAGVTTSPQAGPTAQAAAGGRDLSSIGRYGDLLGKASTETGIPADTLRTIMTMESGGDPNSNKNRSTQYKGLMQLNEGEFKKYGGGDNIFDPEQNVMAGARKMAAENKEFAAKMGREPTGKETFLIHNQGVTGAIAHLQNPDRPAWENAQAAGKVSEDMAIKRIAGNLTSAEKLALGKPITQVTSGDFANTISSRMDRIAGVQAPLATGKDAPDVAQSAEPPPQSQPQQAAAPTEEPALASSARSTAMFDPTSVPEVGPFPSQEAQPGSQGSAPITSMPGTSISSVPPGSSSPEKQDFNIAYRSDAPPPVSASASGAEQPVVGAADAGSALDNWQPGQPIMPALLGDIFGGGGGGGGLFGGGGKMPAFKNLVQSYTPSPDTILPSAGPEQSVLPTSIPPPPPPPPPSPEGSQQLLARFVQQHRRHA